MAEYIGSVKKDDTDMLETTFVQDGDIRQMVVAPKGTSVEELKKLARKQKLAPLYSPEYTKALNTALARRRDPLPEPRPINFRDWRPKKEEETNPIVTFGKSAINQVSELTVGTASMLYAYGNEAGAQLAQDLHGEELSDEAREKWRKEIEEIGRKGWEKSRAVKDMFQFDNTPGESETAQNAGSLITPYLLMGLGYLATGGVAPLVALYGTSSGLGTIEKARLKGDTPKRALMRGVASGFAEAGLERVGANVMISSITNKRLYPLMNRFVFPAWGGVVQEGLQTAKDMAINYDLEPVTADEALDQILTASMWGAFGELAGTQIGYMRNREMIRRSVEEKALAAGHDAKTAKKIARAATPSVNELAGDITETLRENNEQLEKFTFEQMEEYEKSLELTRNLPTEDAAAEVQFYDGLKNVILKGGIEENEARRQAAYWSLMVKNDYELAKESGAHQGNMAEFQRKWIVNIANRKNTRAVKAGNRVVETPVRMTEDEISEAWAARQQERQMTDEEREFFAERPSRKLFSLGDRQTDFTEFKGNPEGAIEKLLQEKNGYVSGAVYKEGIGDIDFIYGQPGKNGYGLAHIIERRNQQGISGEEFVREIPKIIRNGSVYNVLGQEGRKFILSDNKEALIRLDWDGEKRNWLLTAYMKESGALPVGLTSGQNYLNEQTPSSNSTSRGNISSEIDDVNNKLFSAGDTVRGAYDPSERLIELFADAKPDTLTHELSHHFFMNHFRVAQEYGFSEYDRGVMKWLSKQGKHEINGFADMQDQDWENLTEAFIRYLNTGNAPTIATRGIFQKAKEWVLGVYDINRDYASNEVKDFFDALVSREGEIPNIDNIIQNKADFEEAAKRALRGEGATFRGQSIKDIRALRKAINTRVRRPGKTLAQELRALGYRIDNVNRTLVDEKGVVEDARLAEILQELGVLDNVATETYEQTEALSSKMQEILSNADTTYSPREARIRQERETSVANQAKAQQFIDELLKDNQLGIKTIEELDEMLARILSKPDNTDIVKVNRDAIKYLQAKNAEMNKNYREAIRQVKQAEKVRRETQYQLQSRIKDFIRGLPVTGDHKAALMGNIQRVKDADSFEKVLADVRTRAAGYIEQEQKQLNRRNIEETIKSTKPTKFRKQRYTYEDNTFFAEMRDILKMSQEEARAAQEAFAGQIGLQRADNDNTPLDMNISEYDRLKNLLYYYKINGAESSLTALQDLATSLEELKVEAMTKRLDEDELKSAVRKKDKDELLDGINKYKASNIFARGMARIGTVRSAMSEYFGKKMADKWNLETDFEKVNIFMRSKIKPVMDKARKIYGTRRASDFLNLMQQKSRQEFELTDNDGDYDRLSIMEIADIYIGMKDPNTRANYYAAYEKFDDTMPTDRGQLRAAIETMSDEQLREHLLTNNLGTLLSHLSEQDMRFADMVQEEVGSMWELENEIFVKMYGIDLPRNKNYFPRTSKNSLDYDVMENLRVRGQTPGFFKERASTVTPRPKNIWTKYQEYVTSVGYVQNVALKYKDLHSLMTDKAIRGAIVKKYGEDSYRAFMANLDDLSIKGAVKTYNEVGRTMQKLLNNLVSGTVALNVPMAFKQLPAALNYSVNMPKTEFIKNFLYAATHPAEVKRVMDSYVGDFLKTRYEQGSQSDAIGRAMAEADSLVNSKFGLAGFSHNWRQLATTPIRFADIFAIYWGGYAKLKYNIDRGLAPEKIREDFIDETLSNQAAGNPATLAKFQREQSLRFFTAFRNVPAQYMRLITTTMTQWRRGEISDARFFSNIGNYVFVQPALYIWLGWLVKSFLYGDDDDEWFDGMMTEMALSPIAGLPIIADLASFGLDKAESALTGKSPEPWDALQVFGVDTLNKLMWKLVKDDKTGWDWAEIAASVIDVGTGAGLGTAVRTVKKLSD